MDRMAVDARSDDLYRALDGQTLHGSWKVRVASVVTDSSYRWVQLELFGSQHYAFLFRLTHAVDSMGVRRALQWWLAGDGTGENIGVGAIWNGIVLMHMVVEAQPGQPATPQTPFQRIVEPAVEGRPSLRTLWRL